MPGRGRGHRHPVEQVRAQRLVLTCTLSAARKNPPCANSVAVTASGRGCSSPSASNTRNRLAWLAASSRRARYEQNTTVSTI